MHRIVRQLRFWTLLVPLRIVLVVLLAPVALLLVLVHGIGYGRFCWRHRGELFLVCDPRHAWHDFLRNNLLPVLPASVETLWYGRRARVEQWPHLDRLALPGFPKPYLVRVTWRGLRFLSLNLPLRPWKKLQKRSDAVQREVQAVVAEAIERIGG